MSGRRETGKKATDTPRADCTVKKHNKPEPPKTVPCNIPGCTKNHTPGNTSHGD